MKRTLPLMLFLLLASGAVSCSDSTVEETMPREQFIEVFVDLRHEARIELLADGEELSPELAEGRDRVLARHGVEAEDLLHFVEVHGDDLPYMLDVWSEIDAGLAERSNEG